MRKILLSLGVGVSILLTGCATYQANALSALDPEYVKEYPEINKVKIGCKAFSVSDSYTYFDRDILAEGYQPIQLTFDNNSSVSYMFSKQWVSLPCVDPLTVADTVHTNTAGRVVGYSLGGLIFTPLFIPAVVDGIMSSNANKALDQDFTDKAKENLKIAPYSFTKTIVFVPKDQLAPIFNVSLQNQETGKYQEISLSIMN